MTEDWSPYLDPDERVIWEGHPRRGMRLWPNLFLSSLGLPFLFIGIYLLRRGLEAVLGLSGVFDLFELFGGVLFTSIGSGLVVGIWVLEATRHRRISYAISDRRAYIRTGRAVEAVPLEGHSVDTTLLPDKSGTILFGPRDFSQKDKARHAFEDIGDAAEVAAFFRKEPS